MAACSERLAGPVTPNTKLQEGFCSCMIKVGIIGGSGLDDPDILEGRQEKTVTTPFGSPADVLVEGTISGVRCVLLARHGRKHNIMPTNVPYRANIWALKEAGCTHVLVSSACGSLRKEYMRGDLVIPDDIIDRTTQRIGTFTDGKPGSPPGVCHLPMSPCFNEATRQVLIAAVKKLNYTAHDHATMVCIEGPRYSSKAESKMFGMWGGDLINMTIVPEVVLAKEAALLYAGVAIATDYDSWREGQEAVSVKQVVDTFASNVDKVKNIMKEAVKLIAQQDWTEEIQKAKDLVKDNNQALK
ncbi:S-methyl-5'-thioadenosine phosphorylase-like [Anastrepha ludens]|uniref:S-methyl-5'-thioadenosine phosphorylase-like n=1 Tax=Anastrepha ludens TaxID=28586 RepID=UPI0023B10547|nr:S-methyl-5'-thioadenosine phosphorylase-like [Anastrepha ludens]